jgi:hypothetical protein
LPLCGFFGAENQASGSITKLAALDDMDREQTEEKAGHETSRSGVVDVGKAEFCG